MSTDARLSTGLPGHPKTKKLLRRLGPAAGWHLVCLILWARANRPDGDLAGMSAEDIELAVDWGGEPDAFVGALTDVGFLDENAGSFRLHDWAEHQPWAVGADMRAAKARWNAIKRHHGIAEADRQVPEWAAARNADSNAASTKSDAVSNAGSSATSNAPSNAAAMLELERSNAPSPSPSPSEKHESPDGDSESQSDLLDGKVTRHPHDRVCQLVLEVYHAALPNCSRIEVLSPKRQRRILAANKLAATVCKQQGWNITARVFWESYFAECADDPWMRGDVPNPNNARWKQNLFVLIEEDRFAAVMDKAIEAMRREGQGQAA